jgi:DNA-binding beta-propeller fold protein YncE
MDKIPAPGAHGVALAAELHRGFTSNGKDKSLTIFDTTTLAVIKTVKLEGGTDAIVYNPATKRVFPMSEKITVIDAQTGYRRTQGEYHPRVLSPLPTNDPIHRVH